MAHSEFKLLLEELLAPLGPVVLKRMFSGYGLFLDGLMFGLVTGDQLYFKTSEAGRKVFEPEGLGPFTHTKKNAPAILTSYWQAPERLLDEPDEMIVWARIAHQAAIAAQKAKAKSARTITKRAARKKAV